MTFDNQKPNQALQCAGQLAAQPLGLEKLPLVERDAVAQAEAGQEVVPIQLDSSIERLQAAGTDVGLGMAVIPATGQGLPKRRHVHLVVRRKRQTDRLSIHFQLCADGAFQTGQRPAQRGACVGLIGVGVKQRRQCVACSGPAGDGQVGQQGAGLAGVRLNRLAVELDARGAKKENSKSRHVLQSPLIR